MSKTSQRNSISLFSPILVLLITEKSELLKPGPSTTFRPRLPKWKIVFPPTNETGRITIEPEGQEPPGRGSHTLLANHWTPITPAAAAGEMVSGPVTSGRSVARPVKELAFAAGIAPIAPAFPASRVTGFPL